MRMSEVGRVRRFDDEDDDDGIFNGTSYDSSSEGRVSNNDDVCAAGALSRWRSSKDKIRMRLLNWLPKNMCIICCSMRSTPDAFDAVAVDWAVALFATTVHVANDF